MSVVYRYEKPRKPFRYLAVIDTGFEEVDNEFNWLWAAKLLGRIQLILHFPNGKLRIIDRHAPAEWHE